jgi:hypothetical protein
VKLHVAFEDRRLRQAGAPPTTRVRPPRPRGRRAARRAPCRVRSAGVARSRHGARPDHIPSAHAWTASPCP